MKDKKKILILTAIVLAAAVLIAAARILTMSSLWQRDTFTLELTMNGAQEVTVEFGDSYEDPGASALFHGTRFLPEPTEVAVTAEGQVDTSTVGTYYIDYRTGHTGTMGLWDVTLTDYARRTIHVVDTVAPEIVLTADPDGYTIPGQVYQEEGFTATDNYDGDITGRVIRTETPEAVHYQVSDSSGNTAEVDRVIVYHDPIPPELTLKGKQTISLELGTAYKEPGYTASDNCDGDITSWVTVTGAVNTDKAGTYTLQYSVKDSYDNAATASRTVKVVEPEPEPETQAPTEPKPTEPEPTEPEPPKDDGKVDPANPVGGTIYLTFDDGPGRHTGRLLDILAKYNVKASFFVVNTGNYSALTRMDSEGHTVAIHSATHTYKEIYASEEAYFADLEKMQSIIETYTGKTSMLLRFPGGSSNTVSRFNPGIMTRLSKLVEEKGYTYFDWNVDSNDAGGARTATAVYNNVVTGVSTRKNSVVLMHDIHSYTVDAIEDIIIWGLNNGYTFKALTAGSPTCHHGINN